MVVLQTVLFVALAVRAASVGVPSSPVSKILKSTISSELESDTPSIFYHETFASVSSSVRHRSSPHNVTASTSDNAFNSHVSNGRLTSVSLPLIVSGNGDFTFTQNSSAEVKMSFETMNYSFIDLSPTYIHNCIVKSSVNEFNVSFMRITLDNTDSNFFSRGFCSLKINVPQNLVVRMQVTDLRNCSCEHVGLLIYERGENSQSVWTHCVTAKDAFSYTNQILLKIWAASQGPFALRLTLSADAPPPRPQLEMNFTSPTQGYVQTPGWDGKALYPHNMDSWVELPVPHHHKIMVSFHDVDIQGTYITICAQDSLSLYREKPVKEYLVLRICSSDTPPPTLHDASKLHIHFVSTKYSSNSGFRLLFSFHALASVPEKLWDGRWNCSVSYWSDFRLHFPCNLVSECLGGEDEIDCPYTSHVCGQGLQRAGDSCMQFVVADQTVSWDAALDACMARGMLLVTANTPEDWKATSDVVQIRHLKVLFYGLRPAAPSVPYMYKEGLIGVDETFAYFLPNHVPYGRISCFFLKQGIRHQYSIGADNCYTRLQSSYMCEVPAPRTETLPQMLFPYKANWTREVLQCPSQHVTHIFLACDARSDCWVEKYDTSTSCDAPQTSLPPPFTCANDYQRVPYTLVCDGRSDCSDNSDENFCIFHACPLSQFFRCTNKACISRALLCDNIQNCVDGSDEVDCCVQDDYLAESSTLPLTAVIDINSKGKLQAFLRLSIMASPGCPETHFQCPGGNYYCLPVYVRCNDVFDCPGKEDEMACDTYTCPGYYRCRSSRVCLHADHVCDGWPQCPERDDELLCDLSCPDTCVCHGLAFTCTSTFPANSYLDLRFLDASGSGMTPRVVVNNSMLIHLCLARCFIRFLDSINLVNLHSLDLSDNDITSFSTRVFQNLLYLESLSLAGNPLTSLHLTEETPRSIFHQVIDFDISRTKVTTLDETISKIFPNLQRLNVSGSGVEIIATTAFPNLKKLRSVDLKGCPLLSFPSQIFTPLTKLESMYADNYKVCCPASLPERFNLQKCIAPSDEISSCDALLRSDVYRVFLSLFAALALIGNAGSFIYRGFISRKTSNLGFDVFVTNLSIADFVMGVYLAMIGIADRVYLGNYLWNDLVWKHSFVCKLAGFLCLLSSEVSAAIICLVTFDRFLVIQFPFSTFHFFKRSSWIASVIVWFIGFIISAIPLLPSTAKWNFYSQNGICIPIPVSRKHFLGHDYAFGIMIILNGILFLLIATGQGFIFWSVRAHRMPDSDIPKKTKDLTIARRLISVAASDFLCKFPVALLGLLAARGTPISSEAIVALVIFIVPLNSALNPFLYTLNVVLERRRKAYEEKLKRYFMSQAVHKNSNK